ncbi:MAG: tRNA dihydrouridine(20/20a) synthase DusA [Methylococcales bacterium]|jgi:tRNA-dihydrouridine synthase A|nr:tRNA dihydrouridine(20/20a) synthase DusA [Methylococcales bacterium]MBT7445496.1 tRNA dihydrouridine(20/20a) synthase DusA [Methylococcales bacterium]
MKPVCQPLDRTLSIAPMMEYTDRHYRYLMRIISKHTLLFTEMVTTGAIIHGDREKLLGFDPLEQSIVAQVGGNDPVELAQSAQILEDYGYDEVNLNVGCPSDRVKSGRFGACLMMSPEIVAEGVEAMKRQVQIPITVKCRIGVDDCDSYAELIRFVQIVADAGCDALYVHARKALLSGLSPKENRTIPPLKYDWVYQLKQDFPSLPIILNGGVKTLEETKAHLKQVDGVMIGREAYGNPAIFCAADQQLFQDSTPSLTRLQALQAYLPYIEEKLQQGVPLKHISRHLLGLFKGVKGGKLWRRHISENAFKPGVGLELIEAAMQALDSD